MRATGLTWLARNAHRGLPALLGVVVVGSVLAIGSVHAATMVTVGAVATIGACLALWPRLGDRPAYPSLVPAAVLAAMALYTALQLVPLPMSVLQWVAPANADVWQRVVLPLGEAPPGSAPVTLDPGATWLEVLRWLTYAEMFVVAAVVATKHGARLGVGLVFLSAGIAALATMGHGLLGMTRVWSLYEPQFRPNTWHVGPLLNPNNFSGYLDLGALCGMGLLLSNRPDVPRWLLAVGLALIVGVNVTTASRGGIAVLVLTSVALAAIVELSRLRRSHSRVVARRMRWTLAGALGLGVVLALLGGTQRVWSELYDQNVEKLRMLSWLRPMVSEFRWVGMGRGSFESVSPAFQPGQGSTVYTHAENFVAQWLVEWGVPFTVVALAAFAWLLRPRRMGVGRSMLAVGAWMGIVAVLLHNLLDLGLEIPGVAIALVTVMGSLWGDYNRVTAPQPTRLRIGRRGAVAVCAGCAITGATAVVGVLRLDMHDVSSDRRALRDAILADDAPRSPERVSAVRSLIRTSMLRHPAEPYFPLLGAIVAWQQGDQNPVPWIQRALERSLANGKTHLLLAQVLMGARAKSQALLELRLAVENDPTLTLPAARLALGWTDTLEDLLIAVPEGKGRVASLDALGENATDRTLGAACDRKALELDPEREGPHRRLAEDILRAMTNGDECPDPAACRREFDAHVAALDRSSPSHSIGLRLRSRQLAAQGEADRGEKLLGEACERYEDVDDCLRERVRMAATIDDPERLQSAGKALLTAVCISRETCAEVASWLGDLHVERQEWGLAVSSYQRAVREGETADRLLRLSSAASRGGMHAQAVRALERALARRGGHDAALEHQLSRERELLMRPMIGK